MTLSGSDVRHVALLARIGLRAGEEDYYATQLSRILEHIDKMSELDLDAIAPTAQAVEIQPRLRPDRARAGLGQELALANAPATRDGFFQVPAIQEGEA
ncbi:MAG TPA: Asp-tRNA(Asn)/Glu-tRNA(Gln) amidotransferase subunit GatC [Candidatus Nitrosotalea sp.]|nr:Asp-tRNA(Asn)/Glu-tRNA(Gln) amidotransferase subunit GatC [Candidatus Nitrosotalea sp.]